MNAFLKTISRPATYDDTVNRRSDNFTRALAKIYPGIDRDKTVNQMIIIAANIVFGRERLYDNELTRRLSAFDAAIKYANPSAHNFSTTKASMAAVRKIIDNMYGRASHPSRLARSVMRVDQKLMAEQRDEYEDELAAKARNRVGLDMDYFVALVENLAESPNVADIFVACLLACGARTMELMETSTFSKRGANTIEQHNISKQRDPVPRPKMTEAQYARYRAQVRASHRRSIVKPLFVLGADEFLTLVGRIREYVKRNGIIPVRDVARAVDENIIIPGTTPRSCRKIYATLTYATQSRRISEAAYFATVLGHASVGAVESYNHYYVKGVGTPL